MRVVVVDDDPRYRAYLQGLLEGPGDPGRVRGFESGEALLAEVERGARQRRPPDWDTALVALELGGMGGLACVRALRAALPEAGIVVLSRCGDPGTVLEALRAGADGYLLKHAPADRLLAEIRGACSGGAPLGAEIARAVVQALRREALPPAAGTGAGATRFDLTARELDVLRCLARGCSYKAAAQTLGIGVDTVRTHVRRVYAKLGVHSAAEAVGRALREGMI